MCKGTCKNFPLTTICAKLWLPIVEPTPHSFFCSSLLVVQKWAHAFDLLQVKKGVWLQRPNATLVEGVASKIRPDFNRYHRLYGTLVIACDFDYEVGGNGEEGGNLWINASYGDAFRLDERFLALREAPRAFNSSMFHPPFPYEYVYCGSPLFGNLSPQRVREWLAYHSHFFWRQRPFHPLWCRYVHSLIKTQWQINFKHQFLPIVAIWSIASSSCNKLWHIIFLMMTNS